MSTSHSGSMSQRSMSHGGSVSHRGSVAEESDLELNLFNLAAKGHIYYMMVQTIWATQPTLISFTSYRVK